MRNYPTSNYHENYTPEKWEESKKTQLANLAKSYLEQKFVALKPAKIAKLTSDTPDENFALYVHELETSGKVLVHNCIKVISSPLDVSRPADSNSYWYNGRTQGFRFLKTGENKYKLVEITIDSNSDSRGYSYSRETYYKLNGFHVTDVCEITYDGNTYKRKELPKKKSTILITPENMSQFEFLDLVTVYNNIETKIR